MKARLVEQRHSSDCGIAALAMALSRFFVAPEMVEEAVASVCPRALTNGMDGRELEAVARELGYELRRKHFRRVDLANDRGVLGINFNGKTALGHWVYLDTGDIFETDRTVWKATDYLQAKSARIGTLFEIE